MSYLVLARKWRPKQFSEVIGQQHVLRALINGLDQDRLHHAFLFSGTRGVGKTTLARIFAKSLNCEQGVSSKPCGECQSCQEVDAGRFVDLIEVDAASRTKVDDTRELLDNVQYVPSRGRYKVYLIDEVHMLSTSSFNALLKTLEEPPPHVKFLFATTDPQKLPVTILSRCLQFNLRRLELEQISDHLATILQQEEIEFETDALIELARAADGSMRDALSLLDQAISFSDSNVTQEYVQQMLGSIKQDQLFSIVTALINQDGKTLLQQSQELLAQGRDFTAVLNALLALLQRMATLQLVPDLEQSNHDDQPLLIDLSSKISPETLQLLYQIALNGKRDLPFAADPKSGFDMILLRMLSFQPKHIDPTLTKLATTTKSNPATPVTDHIAESAPPSSQAVQKPIPEKTESVGTESQENIELSANNWPQFIANINLAALSRQLADNCAFIKIDAKNIHLSIAPELAHLATSKAKDRLEQALQQHLSAEINLTLKHDNKQHNSQQTLATEQAVERSKQQQQAADSIHNDPAIDALKQAFDARVIESTIKPL